MQHERQEMEAGGVDPTPLVDPVKPSSFPWGLALRVCLVAFFTNCKPSESYLTKYLREDKGLSEDQLNDDVWPWSTYASFLFLLPVAVAAEAVSYRATILAGLVCREATRVLLVFAEGVVWMAVMQVSYSGSVAANTVFFAYVFMVVTEEHYQRLTAFAHAAYHAGNVLASLLGELLVDHASVDKHLVVLFYLSWGFVSVALVGFLFLPQPIKRPPPSMVSIVREVGWRRAAAELCETYRDPVVSLWSLWWIVGFGAQGILVNYYQNQFSNIDSNGNFGYVEAAIEACSVLGSLLPLVAKARVLENRHLVPVVVTVSSLASAAVCWLSTQYQSSVYYSYMFNIAFLTIFAFQSTAASAAIARRLHSARYALVFSANTFVALGTATVVQALCKGLTTNQIYVVVACEELFVAGVFAVILVADSCHVGLGRLFRAAV